MIIKYRQIIIWLCLSILLLHSPLSINSQEQIPDSTSNFPTISWFEDLENAQIEMDSVEMFNNLILAAQKENKDYDYLAALEYYTEALHFQSKVDKSLSYYKTKMKLAQLYVDLGYYKDAESHLTDAIDYFTKNDEQLSLAKALSLQVYCDLKNNAADLAKANILEVIRLNKNLKSTNIRIRSLINQGIYLGQLDNPNTAKSRLNKAIKICRRIGQSKYFVQAHMALSTILTKTKDHKESIQLLLKAQKIAELQNNLFAKRDIYKALSTNLNKIEKYSSAFLYLNQYTELNDSILNKQHQIILNKLIVRHETLQKDKEIISLENEQRISKIKSRRSNLTKYASLFALIAVLISAFFIILYYQQRLASNQIILKQKEQINHQKLVELKTNQQINSMESMMKGQETERHRIAKDLHDSLGGLLSTIKLQFDGLPKTKSGQVDEKEFNRIHDMLDMAVNEVRTISSNLQPGALDKLGLSQAIMDLITKYTAITDSEIVFQEYGINTKLPSAKSIHIYRIVQELLHNSIKHSGSSEILVQLSEDNDELNILVEDDGKGFEIGNVPVGMGAENITSRVNYLKAEISIQSNPGEGTSTMITVPLSSVEK